MRQPRTYQAPLMDACTVPFTQAQMQILDDIEALTHHSFDRQRKATQSTREGLRELNAYGYPTPAATTRLMAPDPMGNHSTPI